MSISNKAILAHLKISQWAGRKLDRKATGQVETSFSTEKQVGNFTKKLLPNAVELEKIHSIVSESRKFFNEKTLPWFSDGTRILSSMNYIETTKELRTRKELFEKAVSEFLSSYSKLMNESRLKLGNLFNENDYPSVESLRDSFSFEISFLPVPEVSDFRTEILESEKAEFLENMKKVESKAIQDCFLRLKTVVENAAKKLASPDAKYKNSLIENISEIVQVLPSLNVYENQDLENMRKEVEKVVSKISPETCRENANERENAAKKLAEINEKMSALMGKV